MIRFIDRKEELKMLNEDWKRQENAFVVVYGRRRIGKTTLLNEFIKDKEGIKYTTEDTSKKVQIKEFKQIIAQYLNDTFLMKQEIEEWSALYEYLEKVMPKNKKMYLWIDEFSYIVKNDPSATSALQKFIDNWVRNSKIFFIVSGSLFGLMSEKILSHASPLYGRRTRDILLKQIPPQYIADFLGMDFEDALKTMLTIGGVPEYLRVSAKWKTYEEFLNEEFLRKDGYFYRELSFLLSQEFKEIRTYFSILNAVSYGNTKPGEIADFVGMNPKEIYPYLELLINYGFIKKVLPIVGSKKKGIYFIDDSFVDMWFNIVHKNRERIEKNSGQIAKEELHQLLGKRFEIFVRDNINAFFPDYERSGKWWYGDKEIDLIALNEKKKEMLIAECKWKEDIESEKIVKLLAEKAKSVEWNNEERKEVFAIFARSFKKKITSWEDKRVYCLDLRDIEKALTRERE